MNLKKISENFFSFSIRTVVWVLLIIALVVFASRGFIFGQQVFSSKGMDNEPGRDVTVTINKSDSLMDVANKLVDEGVVEDKWVYYVQSLIYEGKYIEGEYIINTSKCGEDIVEQLSTKIEKKTQD